MRYGRGIDKETCRRFVLMYVNDFTLALGPDGARRWNGSSRWRIRRGSSPPSPDRSHLVRPENLVLGRPLGGREAGLADQRHDLVHGDRVDVRGGLVDVLLEQRAAPVVGAEVQRDLARRLALGEPRGLHVREVVEVERAAARTRRYMLGPLYCLIHFSSSVLPGLNDHGTKAVKPPNMS